MSYPLYYIIKSELPQQDLKNILSTIEKERQFIEIIRDTKNEKSKKIELILRPGFKELGFRHSVTNNLIPLFAPGCLFEVDYYNPQKSIAIEIERSNLYTKIWLALIKMLESDRIQHGLIMVPSVRVFRNKPEKSYDLTCKRLKDGAGNLLCHLKSLVVIGY